MLSKELKTMRKNQNLSQADVADKLGYSTPQFISNWERGASFPPPNAIKKLAALYKVETNYLFEKMKNNYLDLVRKKLDRKFKAAMR